MAQIIQETVPIDTAGAPTDTVDAAAQARFRHAQKRVEDIRGFYIHLGIYLIVNFCIFLLNWSLIAIGGMDHFWFFYWPLLFWGIGVLINGFVVFFAENFLGPEWEERKIREQLTKERRIL